MLNVGILSGDQIDADHSCRIRTLRQAGQNPLAEKTRGPGDDYCAHGPTMPL
jgi:hypothetical protein